MQIGRGTTPRVTYFFKKHFDMLLIANAYITLAQDGETVIEKSLDDMIVDNEHKMLSITLSQADTLLLDDRNEAEIQLRILFTNGMAARSSIKRYEIGRILKEGVISDED